MLRDIAKGTDTAYVIVSATVLEDLLEQALLANMRDLSNSAYSDLFRGNGPLANFFAKIDLAFALDLIDQTTKTDFHTIREIRNKFAHAKSMAHFEKGELQSVFQKLKGWKKGADTRQLFDERMIALTQLLNSHIDHTIFHAAWRDAEKPEPSRDKS